MWEIVAKYQKRFIQVFCLFLLLIGCFAGIIIGRQKTAGEIPALDKTMDEESIFHIYDSEDFETFLKYGQDGHNGLDAVLETDIEMDKSPYGIEYYGGHFDGQGHKITGVSHELFLFLEKGGIVENLIVDVTIEPEEGYDTGGLVYYSSGTIRGCDVYGTVTGYNYVGGIAAINLGVIENCKNYASVTSLEDGQTIKINHWTDGYGAGGIAGLCATDRGEESFPGICAIIDCSNYGDVTGQSYAGGIVAYLEDRAEDLAPASSVQELVSNQDFITPADQQEEKDESALESSQGQKSGGQNSGDQVSGTEDARENQTEKDWKSQKHYSLMNCRNYGTVTAKNRQDPRTLWLTQAAGICADLSWGNIYHCANLGKVCFDEAAPKQSESGFTYTNCPMAITYNLGFAPTEEHHIVNCVNLTGTIAETMRHENIMELSEEDLLAWEEGDYQGDYISNNWEFDLPNAVEICGLQPLNISPNPLMPQASSGQKKNYYLCDAFSIHLPEYLEIEEASLMAEGHSELYALHITVQKESYEKALSDQESPANYIDGNEECWIVRKDADVQAALKKAKESNTKDSWRVRYFLDELFGTVSPYYYMDICSLNLPFHNSFRTRYVSGRRIFAEGSIPDISLGQYLREHDHMLGNMIAMPLQGCPEEQFKAGWIMVFTMKGTNIHPSRTFIDLVESGFYPFSGNEGTHTVKTGDSLWQLAKDYTLYSKNWKMIAGLNGIDDPDHILAGTVLIVPSLEEWEKDEVLLTPDLIMRYG